MTGPCMDCARNSHALALVGGHLEAMKAGWRPKSVLSLESEALLDSVGGAKRDQLHERLDQMMGSWSANEGDGIRAACSHQGDFALPSVLLDDPEAPWVIWAQGDVELLKVGKASQPRLPSAGIVGARRADAYGVGVARDLGRRVASEGATVVSGLAFGIDGAAHRGALDVAGGKTIAVVGGGVDVVYPKAHSSLHEQIAQRGVVISEMPPGSQLWKWSFPARNRLIAALSDIVVVVQGARRSGSLHTAEAALMRGTQVGAVPGRIDAPISEGTNQLLAEGALPIVSADALVAALGIRPSRNSLELADDLRAAVIAIGERKLDNYLAEVGAKAGAAALARLELMGLVESSTDGGWRVIG